MSFFLIPLRAFFSRKLYRQFAAQGAKRSLGYLLYFGAIWTFALLLTLFFRVYPIVKENALWLHSSLPDLVWSAKGLEAKGQMPLVVEHPRYGRMFVFDTTRESIQPEDLKSEVFYF